MIFLLHLLVSQATEFTLKVQGDTTTAAYNDVNKGTDINNNPFVFINNVFQRPRQDFTVDGSSANVLRFLTGTPSAGRISKVAITTGFGYQTPLLHLVLQVLVMVFLE